MAVYREESTLRLHETGVEGQELCIMHHMTNIARTWGMLSCVALWACAVVMIIHPQTYVYLQWYVLFLALLVTYFEFVWLINYLPCLRAHGCCYTECWGFSLWVKMWKKTFLYWGLAVPCFFEGFQVMLAATAGILMVISGLFYLLETFKRRNAPESTDPTSDKAEII